jgi:hypothetical protein
MTKRKDESPYIQKWVLQPYRWAFLHPAKSIPGTRIGGCFRTLLNCRNDGTPGGVS